MGQRIYMSNRGELSSRNFAAVDSPNVSEAQAIVEYLQSQKDLADRAKKKYTYCHSVQLESASDRCNEKSVKGKEMMQQYNAEWKRRARSLAEFREYEQQRNRVKMQMARKNPVYRDTERECNKKRMKMARKDAAYRDLENKKERKWLGKMQHTGILLKFSNVGRSDWLPMVGEVDNHVVIYGSKVAGVFSAFQRRSCLCYI